MSDHHHSVVPATCSNSVEFLANYVRHRNPSSQSAV